MSRLRYLLPALLTSCLLHGASNDWPQLLGPTRNLVAGAGLSSAKWPTEGPKKLWSKPAGSGWSGPVVTGDRTILFHRIGSEEVVEAVKSRTGETLWTHKNPTRFIDEMGVGSNGPRSTPTIAGDHVVTLGAEGHLQVLRLTDGQPLWSIDCRKEFNADLGYFGMVCSPWVEGSTIYLNLGGKPSAGLVAFHLETGKVLWKVSDEGASYSSPVGAAIDGTRQILFLTPYGLVSVDPANGRERFRFPLQPEIQASVSAATPLVIGNQVFLSASYGAGAALVSIVNGKPEKVWAGDDILSNHYATSVHHGGYLFGFDGRQEQGCHLRCIDLKSGKVAWTEDRFGAGTLLLAGSELLILTEKGELIRAEANPKKFTLKDSTQLLPFKVRAYPALANGLFVARSEKQWTCVDLSSNP